MELEVEGAEVEVLIGDVVAVVPAEGAPCDQASLSADVGDDATAGRVAALGTDHQRFPCTSDEQGFFEAETLAEPGHLTKRSVPVPPPRQLSDIR